jgi:hypothetical protein
LQNTAKVEQLTANWQKIGSKVKSNLVVEFKNSKAVVEIFSKIPGAACTYVVEITPLVEEVSTSRTTNRIQKLTILDRVVQGVVVKVTPYNDPKTRLARIGQQANLPVPLEIYNQKII